jgi:hypothetical protein
MELIRDVVEFINGDCGGFNCFVVILVVMLNME